MVIAAGFLVLVAFLIPVLLMVNKTVKNISKLGSELHQEILGITQDARQISEEALGVSRLLKEKTQRALDALEAVGEVGDGIKHVNAEVQDEVHGLITGLNHQIERLSSLLGHAAEKMSQVSAGVLGNTARGITQVLQLFGVSKLKRARRARPVTDEEDRLAA